VVFGVGIIQYFAAFGFCARFYNSV